MRDEGGRADLLATGGDVASGHVLVVSECWNTQLASVYRIQRDCPADGVDGAKCTVVSTTGDPTACPVDLLVAELPPADPDAAMSDPQSPVGDVTPPVSMPDGTPPGGN
jgi:hypothetical protein